jgi:hypothetical protein
MQQLKRKLDDPIKLMDDDEFSSLTCRKLPLIKRIQRKIYDCLCKFGIKGR